MKPFRIFGLGSPFGDDRVGWRVIEILIEKSFSEYWHLEYCDRPGLGLLKLIEDARVVILIDAVKSGSNIGHLHCWREPEHFELIDHLISSHGFGLKEALQIGKTLDCLPEKIIVYGIEIEELATFKLSKQAEMAAQRLAEIIIHSMRNPFN